MSKEFPITISSWTLGDQCKFEDRVIAAKNAGYEGIGLRAETYVDALNEGLFDKDILAILDKHGMKVTEVEYIVQWAEEHRSYEQKYKDGDTKPPSHLLFFGKTDRFCSDIGTVERVRNRICTQVTVGFVLRGLERFALASDQQDTTAV